MAILTEEMTSHLPLEICALRGEDSDRALELIEHNGSCAARAKDMWKMELLEVTIHLAPGSLSNRRKPRHRGLALKYEGSKTTQWQILKD